MAKRQMSTDETIGERIWGAAGDVTVADEMAAWGNDSGIVAQNACEAASAGMEPDEWVEYCEQRDPVTCVIAYIEYTLEAQA